MFNLDGKSALVTGASGGIGKGVALALHAAGAKVALSARRTDALEALAKEMGARAHVLPCALDDREALKGLPKQAEEAMGGLDILVNNAGITRDGLVLRMGDSDWDDVLAVDLTAAFLLCRAALRGMIKRRFGRIISVASVSGVLGNAGQANYAAAKAGLVGLTKALARETATRGITVNAIAPGFIETPMTEALSEAQREAALGLVPLGRFGTTDEIAAASLYLASDEAAYITGHTLHVNGGMAMI